MGKCSDCGRELVDGARYCDRCGMIHLPRPWEIFEEKSLEELVVEKLPGEKPPEPRPAQAGAPLPMVLPPSRRRRLVKALAVLVVVSILLVGVVYQTGWLTGEKIGEREVSLSGAAGVGANFKYNSAGPTFNFVMKGYGLEKRTQHELFLYNSSSGTASTLLARVVTNDAGDIRMASVKLIDSGLRDAKIQLVRSSDRSVVLESQYAINYEHRATGSQTRRLVALVFDDAWQNQLDVAVPILRQHDFKATFGVITQRVGVGSGSLSRYMNWDALRSLAADGMDIASHTRTHSDLTTLNESAAWTEISGSKQDLENNGFSNVRTFVYPYYEYDNASVAMVKRAGYIVARDGLATTHPTFTAGTDSPFEINGIGVTSDGVGRVDQPTFEGILDWTGETSTIVLVYHFILPDGTSCPRDQYGECSTTTWQSDFEWQMQYLKDNGFTVVLLPDTLRT